MGRQPTTPGWAAVAGAATVAALGLAACGGGSGASRSTSSSPAATSTTLPSTTTLSPTTTTVRDRTTTTTSPPPTTVPPTTTQPPPPFVMGPGSWLTYGGDGRRDGVSGSAMQLSGLRRVWQSAGLSGQIYAEPLIYKGLVLLATEADNLYAVDGSTGSVVWSLNIGTPVPGSDLPCGNIDPLGVTSTPVIDPSSGLLYAVAEQISHGRIGHRLYAVDAAHGHVAFSEPVDPSGMTTPADQQQRGALALSHGRVYIAYGGLYGDCGTYSGWVVSVPTGRPGPMESFDVNSTGDLRGGVWSPGGPSVDAAGDIWVATGNDSRGSPGPGRGDFGDAVIELSPALRMLDWFVPSDYVADDNGDLDLGSTTPEVLGSGGSGLVFQVGKEATGYLLRTGRLGHLGGQAFGGQVCFTIGAVAYYAPFAYVSCGSGLEAVEVAGGQHPSFGVRWTTQSWIDGPPVIAGGLIWSVSQSTGALYALSPATGGVVEQASLAAPPDNYAAPAATAGVVVVASGDVVQAFAGS